MDRVPESDNGKVQAGFGAATDPGLKRDHNEDTYFADPELGLWLVADGMGGYLAGEVASDIVRKTVAEQVSNGVNLADAVQAAHAAVLQAGDNGVGARGMGATIVAVLLRDHEYQVAWVGDSRVYLWDGGVLRQLTTDHSVVQQLLDGGVITPQEALTHPNRNLVTQALGVLDAEQVIVDVVSGHFLKGQRLLLCSDGLTDEVTDDIVAGVFTERLDERSTAQRLVEEALARGGRDNVTVVVVSASPAAPSDYPATGSMEAVPAASGEPAGESWLRRNASLFFPVVGGVLAVLLVLIWRYLS